ncbi:7501_t:CDS:10, partial [Ambispora gerdemannii]
MKYLCVAEKPSVSKSLAQILAQGLAHTSPRTEQSANKYIKNYTFSFQDNTGFLNEVTITAVLGHLTEIDFVEGYNWQECNPISLFDAPIQNTISQNMTDVAQNLKNRSYNVECVMIWTDCDREGENIGKEVVEVCRQRNSRIIVKRARFSAIESRAILQAWWTSVNSSLEQLDMNQSDAVEARMELDLRIGAAFTRYQTLGFQGEFPGIENNKIISFGPCQIPTLGFVVDRWEQRENFTVEKFWYIEVTIKQDDEKEVTFRWVREQFPKEEQLQETPIDQREKTEFSCFEELFVEIFMIKLADHDAIVTKVNSVPKSKWKPRPLTTVELLKLASKVLRINSDATMIAAERLYQLGFITYPRTDTDQFPPSTDFKGIIATLKGGSEAALNNRPNDANLRTAVDWIPFADGLLVDKFSPPRNGSKNDGAHPPIHPIKYPDTYLDRREERDLFNFIVRYFLASCAEDAKGQETTVEIMVEEETFRAKGLVILERNYLEVYPYEKWGARDIPDFREGQVYKNPLIEKKEGKTSPPELLTEPDLIACLYENEIGTDATIPEHISKIFVRNYAAKERQGQKEYIYPSDLGLALVHGYREIGFEYSLSKPFLRRNLERELQMICQNQKTKDDVARTYVQKYRNMYDLTLQEEDKIVQAFMRHLGPPKTLQPDGSYYLGARKIDRRRMPPSNNSNNSNSTVPTQNFLDRDNSNNAFTATNNNNNFGNNNTIQSNNTRGSTTRSNSHENSTCFKCKQIGHWASECTSSSNTFGEGSSIQTNNSTNGTTRTYSRDLSFYTCYICKEPGHLAPNCPTRNRQSPSLAASSMSTVVSNTRRGTGRGSRGGGTRAR